MKRIMLVGDYYHGLAELHQQLQKKYEVYPIAFMDFELKDRSTITPPWHPIDFRDFHELTIRIMEYEPDFLIYLPYMMRYHRAEVNPELAEMANVEAVEHIRQTVGIHNTFLILIQTSFYPKADHNSVLKQTQLAVRELLSGMAKSTILEIPILLDKSDEGIISWIKYKKITNHIKGVTPRDLFQEISHIINHKTSGFVKLLAKSIDLTDIDLDQVPVFRGDDNNFTFLTSEFI